MGRVTEGAYSLRSHMLAQREGERETFARASRPEDLPILTLQGDIIKDDSQWQGPLIIQERFIPVAWESGSTNVLKEDIFWTQAALDDHIALYNKDTKEMHPDVHKWATIRKTITDPSSHGWEIIKDEKGKEFYKFYCRLAIRYQGPNVEFAWQISDNESDAYAGEPQHC